MVLACFGIRVRDHGDDRWDVALLFCGCGVSVCYWCCCCWWWWLLLCWCVWRWCLWWWCVCAVVYPVLNWVSHIYVCSPYIRWWWEKWSGLVLVDEVMWWANVWFWFATCVFSDWWWGRLPHLNVTVTVTVLSGCLVLMTVVGGNGMYGLNIDTAYAYSVVGGVPGSPLDYVVCLSVTILSIIVLILMRSGVRIKYKYRYKYIYIQDPNQRF